jgi:hypothetical protein
MAMSYHRLMSRNLLSTVALVPLMLLTITGCSAPSGPYSPLEIIDKMKNSVGCSDDHTGGGGFTTVIKDGQEYDDGGTNVSCDTKGDGLAYISVYDTEQAAQENLDRMCSDLSIVNRDLYKDHLWGANWVVATLVGPVLLTEVQDALGGEILSIDGYCKK